MSTAKDIAPTALLPVVCTVCNASERFIRNRTDRDRCRCCKCGSHWRFDRHSGYWLNDDHEKRCLPRVQLG